MVKNLPAVQETQVLTLGQKVSLEKGMTTHSSIGLKNSVHRVAWWATVHGVAKSQTWVSNEHFQLCVFCFGSQQPLWRGPPSSAIQSLSSFLQPQPNHEFWIPNLDPYFFYLTLTFNFQLYCYYIKHLTLLFLLRYDIHIVRYRLWT